MTQYSLSIFTAFGSESIYEFTKAQNLRIVEGVKGLPDAELFDSDEETLVNSLVARYHLRVPTIDFEHRKVELLPPDDISVALPNRYASPPQQLIKYTLPVSGNINLLKIQPTSTQMIGFNGLPEMHAQESGIVFYVPDYGGDPQTVANNAKQVLDNLRVNSQRLGMELESYKATIVGTAQQAIRFERLRRQQDRQRGDDLRNLLP